MCTACKPLNGTGPGHTVNEKESEEGQEQRADAQFGCASFSIFNFSFNVHLFLTFVFK